MKLVAYVENSVDKKDLEQQIKACEDFCRDKGFEFEVFNNINNIKKGIGRPKGSRDRIKRDNSKYLLRWRLRKSI